MVEPILCHILIDTFHKLLRGRERKIARTRVREKESFEEEEMGRDSRGWSKGEAKARNCLVRGKGDMILS